MTIEKTEKKRIPNIEQGMTNDELLLTSDKLRGKIE